MSVADRAEVEYAGNTADLAKTKGTLTIPKTVKDRSGNTYKVTSIRKSALKGAKFKNLSVPDTVTKFGKNCLYNSNAKSLTIRINKKAKAKNYKFGNGAFKTNAKKMIIKVKCTDKKVKESIVKKISNKKVINMKKTTVK